MKRKTTTKLNKNKKTKQNENIGQGMEIIFARINLMKYLVLNFIR